MPKCCSCLKDNESTVITTVSVQAQQTSHELAKQASADSQALPVPGRELCGFLAFHPLQLFRLPPSPLLGLLVPLHTPPCFPRCPRPGFCAEVGQLQLPPQLRRLAFVRALLSLGGFHPAQAQQVSQASVLRRIISRARVGDGEMFDGAEGLNTSVYMTCLVWHRRSQGLPMYLYTSIHTYGMIVRIYFIPVFRKKPAP